MNKIITTQTNNQAKKEISNKRQEISVQRVCNEWMNEGRNNINNKKKAIKIRRQEMKNLVCVHSEWMNECMINKTHTQKNRNKKPGNEEKK